MARVLLVHGAFNELWGPHELKARWYPALSDGVWHHGASIDVDDVDICFYGDLFRLDLKEVDPDQWEKARAGAAELLDSIGGEKTLGFLSQAASNAAYDRTIDMVTIMQQDADLQDKTRARLLDRIGPETQVVVAHSLGSVISHQTLAANPDVEVDMLVTIGSPLGSDMLFGQLEPSAVDGVGPWPGSAKRWVNIAAYGDHAAAVSELATKFGPKVEDHLIDNGHRAHDPEPYLNSSVTGRAILEGIGG